MGEVEKTQLDTENKHMLQHWVELNGSGHTRIIRTWMTLPLALLPTFLNWLFLTADPKLGPNIFLLRYF